MAVTKYTNYTSGYDFNTGVRQMDDTVNPNTNISSMFINTKDFLIYLFLILV